MGIRKGGPIGPPGRIPSWMDSNDAFGQLTFLSLMPAAGSTLPRDHILVVGKTIQEQVGKIDDAHTEEQGTKYVLRVKSNKQCEKLLSLEKLNDGTPIIITYHSRLNRCQCVISC